MLEVSRLFLQIVYRLSNRPVEVFEDLKDSSAPICHDGPTPRCLPKHGQADSYFTTSNEAAHLPDQELDTLSGLVSLLRSETASLLDRTSESHVLTRQNIHSVTVEYFLAWQKGFVSLRPTTQTTPLHHSLPTMDSGHQRSAPVDLHQSSYTSARPSSAAREWEANTSRRHALLKRNKLKRESDRCQASSPPNDDEKAGVSRKGLFWDASSSSEGVSARRRKVRRSRVPSPSPPLPKEPCEKPSTSSPPLPPLRTALANVFKVFLGNNDGPTSIFKASWSVIGWTCLGLAAGLGCVWLSTSWFTHNVSP